MKKTAEHKAVDLLVRFHLGRRRPPRLKHPARQSDYNATRAWGWRENILGFGIGEKHVAGERQAGVKCLTLFVRRKLPGQRILDSERIPASLRLESVGESIVTDLVVVPGPPRAQAPASKQFRPVQSGAGIGHIHGGGGTLGLLVQQGGSGPILALSCSHVLARSGNNAQPGDTIVQPWGGSEAGTLTGTFTVFSESGTFDEDMALAALDVAVVPQMADSGIIANSFSSLTDFPVGTRVSRNGVATGQQSGAISNSQTAWNAVEVPFAPDGRVNFTGLVAYSAPNDGGDSGAAVLDGNNIVVGLHVAGIPEQGISLFEPIGPIMSRHNLTLFTG